MHTSESGSPGKFAEWFSIAKTNDHKLKVAGGNNTYLLTQSSVGEIWQSMAGFSVRVTHVWNQGVSLAEFLSTDSGEKFGWKLSHCGCRTGFFLAVSQRLLGPWIHLFLLHGSTSCLQASNDSIRFSHASHLLLPLWQVRKKLWCPRANMIISWPLW